MRKADSSSKAGYRLIERALQAALKKNDASAARRLIKQASEQFRQAGDPIGELNALHFTGRIEHQFENQDEALRLYDAALKVAERINCLEIAARARHERARIFSDRCQFIEAEAGFRFAINYYGARKDSANFWAAVYGLRNLAQDGLFYSDYFLESLE